MGTNCHKIRHFNMEVYGDWVTFGVSPKWALMELQFMASFFNPRDCCFIVTCRWQMRSLIEVILSSCTFNCMTDKLRLYLSAFTYILHQPSTSPVLWKHFSASLQLPTGFIASLWTLCSIRWAGAKELQAKCTDCRLQSLPLVSSNNWTGL